MKAWRVSSWSFVDAQGVFTGRIYSGSEEFLELNTPPDCTAVEGKLALPPPVATLDQMKAGAVSRIQCRLVAEDAATIRPLAELVQALATGAEPPAEALARLQDIAARKEALRATLGRAEAAEKPADLEAIDKERAKP